MLRDFERQEIFDIVENYQKAYVRRMKHYNSKSASEMCEVMSGRAYRYLDWLYHDMDKINSDDVKCFSVLVNVFEPMRRNTLLKQLQKHADFDVYDYIKDWDRGDIKHSKPKFGEKLKKLQKNMQENIEKRVKKSKTKLKQLGDSGRVKMHAHKNERKEIFQSGKAKIAGVFGAMKAKLGQTHNVLKQKCVEIKAEHENAKRNRKIIRDAEFASRKHWKEIKKQQKSEKPQNVHRNIFVRGLPYLSVGILLVGGVSMLNRDSANKKVNVVPVKKEIKIKPVVQKQEVAPVAIDTVYAAALKNYYNSALDIIAGADKKADVLSKIQAQVNSGNIGLTDSVTIERIAYAYFIYREYGFQIDVLDLAVNGNQKLTDGQQAELIRVIMDAGERGTGVQKQAKQSVNARGGVLSQHSKFKNATKQQQRQHLANLGVLKKVQNVR